MADEPNKDDKPKQEPPKSTVPPDAQARAAMLAEMLRRQPKPS